MKVLLFKIFLIFTGLVVFTTPVFAAQNSTNQVAVEFAKKGEFIDLSTDAGWLGRIDGDITKLTNSHLNAAKLIASRGIRVNADELPSILANVSGDISRLSTSRLEFALKTLKTTVLNVDEFNISINKVVNQGISEDYIFNKLEYIGNDSWKTSAGLKFQGYDPQGLTRIEHIMLHRLNNMNKDIHGVFDNSLNIVETINEYALLRNKTISPTILQPNGNYITIIDTGKVIGNEGGWLGNWDPLTKLTIISADPNMIYIITAFPSR